jgi:hypothetical protein
MIHNVVPCSHGAEAIIARDAAFVIETGSGVPEYAKT